MTKRSLASHSVISQQDGVGETKAIHIVLVSFKDESVIKQ